MGRGVSYGGGQSSLGYLFGGGGTPAAPNPARNDAAPNPARNDASPKAEVAPVASVEAIGDSPAGIHRNKNNYFRPDGQNCGNFITDRPSTKVHAEPGGGSSLGYLFGGGKNN